MKKGLIISITINLVFIVFGSYVIHKKGGMDYLQKFFSRKKTDTNTYQGTGHSKIRTSFFEAMPNDTNEIIFLGNSLTEFGEWSEMFGKTKVKNRGISQDKIIDVINRLDEIVESFPDKIFIMLGT